MIRVTVDKARLSRALQKYHDRLLRKDRNVLRDETQRAMMKAQQELIVLTAKWSHKPQFTLTEIRGGVRGWKLVTDDDVFNILDKGAKKHTISAGGDEPLAFEWAKSHQPGKYIPKTTPPPLTFKSSLVNPGAGGTYSGGSVVVKMEQVDHPGVKGRHWTDLLSRKYSAEAIANVRDEIAILCKDLSK